MHVCLDSAAATTNSNAEFCTHVRFTLLFSLGLRRIEREGQKIGLLGCLTEKIDAGATCTPWVQWRTQEFVLGVQQIHLRTKRMGSGGGSPKSAVLLNLKISEKHILIRFLHMYFPRNWEFGSSFGAGV
jgi:hypothetical protein